MSLNIAVLTVSDTRTQETDKSGATLVDRLQKAGHQLSDKKIVVDDIYQIRAAVSAWVANENINVIITTGGTGFSNRDSTPEALRPLFDKEVEGFGELFRAISFQLIKSSTIQSRCIAGLANRTLIFALPGSVNACKTAWDEILCDQLDESFKPCNFVAIVGVGGSGNEA